MSDFIDRLMPLLWKQTWQIAAVVVAITLVTRVKPIRCRPHLAYALWLLVLAKCLTPPLLASPTSAFSWALASAAAPTVESTPKPTPETSLSKVATSPDPAPQFVPPSAEQPLVESGAQWIETSSRGELTAAELALPPPTDGADTVSTLPTGLALTWLIGGMLYFTLSLGRYTRTRRRLIHSACADTAQLDEMIGEISRSLRLRRSPRAILAPQPFGPAVLGLLRPVLVVPKSATFALAPERLRLVLAHELVHLRRGDHWMGLVQFLVQALWWFNPLVWWANREMSRIREQCCDEEVLANLRCEPAGYAQTLLDVVRLGARSRPLVLTAGVGALHVTGQRLEHIMSDASRFRRSTPRAYWLVAGLIAWLLLPGAGLAIDQDNQAQSESAQEADATQAGRAASDETAQADGVRYTGRVIDKESGKPIERAVVKLRQRKQSDNVAAAKTTEHRTDDRGEFIFSLPVKHESEYLNYHLWGEVEHPQYLRREIRQGEGRAGQPFFKQIDMYRGVEMRGVVETPDGQPCRNTRIVVYSVPDPDARWDQVQLTTATTTDDEGKFRVPASQAGVAAFWVVPDDYAPLALDLGGKRGDLGTLHLENGLRLNGRVVDYDGRPVSGALIIATLNDRIISQIGPPLGGNEMRRYATTDEEGRFRLAPLRSGSYRLVVDTARLRKDSTLAIASVFPSSNIRLSEDEQTVEIQPAELVTVDVRCADTSGRPVSGVRVSLSGDDFYHSQYQTLAQTGNDGRTLLAWPKGFRARLSVFGNNEQYLYRATQDALPPGDYELVNLGRVEKDLRNIEIVQWKAAKLIVKAIDQRGKPIADFKPEIRYSATPANMSRYVARGWRSDVSFIRLADGRWQSKALLPNEGFTISATATTLQSVSQQLKLAEGEIREVELKLVATGQPTNGEGQERKGEPPTKRDGKNGEKPEANPAKDSSAKSLDERAAQPLNFTGAVIERGTKKPIGRARVTITRRARKGTDYVVLGTSEHETNGQGEYQFALGAEVAGHERLLITPSASHDNYVAVRFGSFGVNLAEEAKRPRGVRQLGPIEVVAGERVSGTVEMPDGKLAAKVPVVVKSLTEARQSELPEGLSSRVDLQTDGRGRFEASVIKQANAAITIEPNDHALRIVVVGQKRGDLGHFRLSAGIRLAGTVVDDEGRAVGGAWVNAFSNPDEPSFIWLEEDGELREGGAFAERVTRAVRTDEQGKFEFKALGTGKYVIAVLDRSEDIWQPTGESAPLPVAFQNRTISLEEGEPQQSIELRGLPSYTIEATFADSNGEAVEAQDRIIRGMYQGDDFGSWARQVAPGKLAAKVPQGIRELTLPLHMIGGRFRIQKDQPLRTGHEVKLGVPITDLRDIQVVTYNEPRLIVKAVDEQGLPIKNFKPKIEYPEGTVERAPGSRFITGIEGDVFMRSLNDGRWRSGGLLPDQEFTVTLVADGYRPATQKLKLAEGESKEVELRLDKP